MGDVEFLLGEDKHIKLLVRSVKGDAFTIHNATWELCEQQRSWNVRDNVPGRVEASGACTVDGPYIDVKIRPQKAMVYKLTITYEIADEVLKQRVKVTVG